MSWFWYCGMALQDVIRGPGQKVIWGHLCCFLKLHIDWQFSQKKRQIKKEKKTKNVFLSIKSERAVSQSSLEKHAGFFASWGILVLLLDVKREGRSEKVERCFMYSLLLLLLLSRFSRVWLCATPWTAAHQAPPSLGFSRQEHWSGLPFPSPMNDSEKWKWSCSVVSNS